MDSFVVLLKRRRRQGGEMACKYSYHYLCYSMAAPSILIQEDFREPRISPAQLSLSNPYFEII